MKIFHYKVTAGAVATLGALFALLNSPDVNLFYSQYFAGLAGGVAVTMWLDD